MMHGVFDESLIVLAPVIGQCLNTALHIAWNHASKGAGHLGSIVLCFLAGLICNLSITAWALSNMVAGGSDWLGALALNSATFAGFGYCYFTFVNLLRTSLRVRVLSELFRASNRTMTTTELHSVYDERDIVDIRIKRLQEWKQLKRKGDRFYPDGTAFWLLGTLLQCLKALTGIVQTQSCRDHE